MIYDKEDSIGFVIHRTSRAFVSLLNSRFAAHGFDIKVEHWSVLYNLYVHGSLPQQEIGLKTCYDKTTITRVIEHLVRLEMVVRFEDSEDRRKQIIGLTNYALGIKNQLEFIIMKEVRGDAMKGISSTDEHSLKDMLNRIYSNISDNQSPCRNIQTTNTNS